MSVLKLDLTKINLKLVSNFVNRTKLIRGLIKFSNSFFTQVNQCNQHECITKVSKPYIDFS